MHAAWPGWARGGRAFDKGGCDLAGREKWTFQLFKKQLLIFREAYWDLLSFLIYTHEI